MRGKIQEARDGGDIGGALFETSSLSFGKMIYYRDMTLPGNSVVFITGTSGCGKTTLFKMLNKTLPIGQGSIHYHGTDIQKLDVLKLRQEVSLVSQEVFLFDKTVEENFNEFYSYRNLPPIGSDEIERYLSLCCLDCPLNKDTASMSGGERQRLYLAIFLSFRPNVLLLDEPTSALDHETAHQLMENITNHTKQSNISLLVISHDAEITQKFSEYTVTEIAEKTL